MNLAFAGRRTAGVTLMGAALLLRPGSSTNRLARHQLVRASQRLHFLSGRLQGVSYRLSGRHPDPHVPDDVLADRIRSSLGVTAKALDLPRVHVMVQDHVALLHGEADTPAHAAEFERAVAAVPGVAGVESFLHVGLLPSDSRPSEGRRHRPASDALTRLTAAATGAGVAPDASETVTRAVLATFADRLPAGERAQVAVHLPADVRQLFTPPRRSRHRRPARTTRELVEQVASATGGLTTDQVERATVGVIGCLRTLVPEEDQDVRAVLPAQLKSLWDSPAPS